MDSADKPEGDKLEWSKDEARVMAFTEEEIVERTAQALAISEDAAAVSNSSQSRQQKQKRKLRKKLCADAAESMAVIQNQPFATAKVDPGPNVMLQQWKDGQRACLRERTEQLGVSQHEGIQFVDSFMQTIANVRTKNRKLVELTRQIEARLVKASSNCLFKLATCTVRMQPGPTPGWSWVKGTLDDDEYHAFKELGTETPTYWAFTISYEKGCVGQVNKIFALAQLTLLNAMRARYDMLTWNNRLVLLDAIITRVTSYERPENQLASTSLSLAAGVGSGGASQETEFCVTAEMRRTREVLVDQMLTACEQLSERESTGQDYKEQNYIIAVCHQSLPATLNEFNRMLRAVKIAHENGQAVELQLPDGRTGMLGRAKEEDEGIDVRTLAKYDFVE